MDDIISIEYSFTFSDNSIRKVRLDLRKEDLLLVDEEPKILPEWTKLNKNKCPNCPLKPEENPNCPVAVNLIKIIDTFSDHFSYHEVDITVTTDERTFQKSTKLQTGLSALIGIVMVTCGCPVMEKLKPMVRFHLPFATLEETFFRMFSMYLMSQYIVQRKGGEPKWEFEGLTDIYNEVSLVNRAFGQRLSGAATTDAHMNALVNLDCFASIIPLSIDEYLMDIEGYFSSYYCDL